MKADSGDGTSYAASSTPLTPSMSGREDTPTHALALDERGQPLFYICEPGSKFRDTVESEISEGINNMSLHSPKGQGLPRPRFGQVSSAMSGSAQPFNSQSGLSTVPAASKYPSDLGAINHQRSEFNDPSNQISSMVPRSWERVKMRQHIADSTNPQSSPNGTTWVSPVHPQIRAQSGRSIQSTQFTPREISLPTDNAKSSLERDGFIILNEETAPTAEVKTIPNSTPYVVDGHPVYGLNPTLMSSALSHVSTSGGYHQKLESILSEGRRVSREDVVATLMRMSVLPEIRKRQLEELQQSVSEREQYVNSLKSRLAAISAISQTGIGNNITDVFDDTSSVDTDSIHY